MLSGFKKGVNRATTQVMMKTGHVERTNDRDFETELRRYRTMETAANKLQKEAKGYLDSLRGWWTGRNTTVAAQLTGKYSYDGLANAYCRDD